MLMVYISSFFIIYPSPTHEINPGTTNFSDCCVMIELVNTEVRAPIWKKDFFCVCSPGSIWAFNVHQAIIFKLQVFTTSSLFDLINSSIIFSILELLFKMMTKTKRK